METTTNYTRLINSLTLYLDNENLSDSEAFHLCNQFTTFCSLTDGSRPTHWDLSDSEVAADLVRELGLQAVAKWADQTDTQFFIVDKENRELIPSSPRQYLKDHARDLLHEMFLRPYTFTDHFLPAFAEDLLDIYGLYDIDYYHVGGFHTPESVNPAMQIMCDTLSKELSYYDSKVLLNEFYQYFKSPRYIYDIANNNEAADLVRRFSFERVLWRHDEGGFCAIEPDEDGYDDLVTVNVKEECQANIAQIVSYLLLAKDKPGYWGQLADGFRDTLGIDTNNTTAAADATIENNPE